MRFVTVSGPPSTGKTSVILKTIEHLQSMEPLSDRAPARKEPRSSRGSNKQGHEIGVVKFDCLSTNDDEVYEKHGVLVRKGLSGALCPDHFFVSNVEEVVQWGREHGLDLLISESAGLCNRCSPYIKEVLAVCVIDNLAGVNTPRKIGPMLKSADIVVVTKGDIVSQAEREVFARAVAMVNPKATVMHVNGITGQGAFELATLLREGDDVETVKGRRLRFSMPAALCSYCLGETRIGEAYQQGNVRKINLEAKR